MSCMARSLWPVLLPLPCPWDRISIDPGPDLAAQKIMVVPGLHLYTIRHPDRLYERTPSIPWRYPNRCDCWGRGTFPTQRSWCDVLVFSTSLIFWFWNTSWWNLCPTWPSNYDTPVLKGGHQLQRQSQWDRRGPKKASMALVECYFISTLTLLCHIQHWMVFPTG